MTESCPWCGGNQVAEAAFEDDEDPTESPSYDERACLECGWTGNVSEVGRDDGDDGDDGD